MSDSSSLIHTQDKTRRSLLRLVGIPDRRRKFADHDGVVTCPRQANVDELIAELRVGC